MCDRSSIILPPPPAGKSGWPWLQGNHFFPPKQSGHHQFPKISIITPSFNQASFLEETIRSVLLQNYSNLEYIIIDGGSTDGSVDIIRKYAPWLTCWVSESDKGQADAINKGLQYCTGDIVAWINSDDYYSPNALNFISKIFVSDPAIGLVYGDIQIKDWAGRLSGQIGYRTEPSGMLSRLEIPFQPASFFRNSLIREIGPLDISLHYVMDVDILLRAMSNAPFEYFHFPLAVFRIHDKSKTDLAESKFGFELLGLREHVLNHLGLYPGFRQMSPSRISSNFYRLACKHFYQGDHYYEAARCIWAACRNDPASTLSILSDEGIGWLIKLLLPIKQYRTFSHRLRSKLRKL